MAGRQWTLGRGSLRGLALGLVAALVMVLGLCPAIALADDVEVEVEPTGGEEPTLTTQGDPVLTPQDDIKYPLMVGGVRVTSGNAASADHPSWKYEPEDAWGGGTLTLNRFNYDAETQEPSMDYGIAYEGERVLTIELKGTNTVKGKGGGIASFNPSITIRGNGTLTAEGRQYGIGAFGNNSTLEIVGGATVTAKATGEDMIGVFAGKDIVISDATVTAEGGAYGIYAGDGVVVGKDVTSFVASGSTGAIASDRPVKNAIAGLGWTDAAGTQGKTVIPVSEKGQTLPDYKRVRFPVPTYAVSVKADPAEGGTATASAEKAAEEEAVTLSAKSNDGYEFAGWTIEGEGARIDDANKPEAKLTMGAADVTATATFRKIAPIVTAHVQRIGWMSAVSDGGLAGTTGKSRRLEALTLTLPDGVSGGIEYCGHVQRSGWEKSYAADGKVAGTEGKSRRLEAVQIRLSGAAKDNYDVYYRVHVQRLGWMGWAKNGDKAGTEGMSRRAEAVQVALVPKDAPAPLATYKGVTQEYSKAFIKK